MPNPAVDPLAVCIEAIHGIDKPPATAFVVEAACVGCTLCIQACPVDAIVGAAGQMHTVVAEWCTGCELCLPPCPVDCISMLALPERSESIHSAVARARQRCEFRLQRNAREQHEKAERLAARAAAVQFKAAADTRKTLVTAAVTRARQINVR
jgi:electron transport complex protein RnfB